MVDYASTVELLDKEQDTFVLFLLDFKAARLNEIHSILTLFYLIKIISFIKMVLLHIEYEFVFYKFWKILKKLNLVKMHFHKAFQRVRIFTDFSFD